MKKNIEKNEGANIRKSLKLTTLAFTLIELIATIGLLGMLSTILITVSVRKINETKEKSKDTMIKSIELAATNYVTDYKEELTNFKINDNIYVSLQTLVEKEYFTESLVDQTTDKALPLSDNVYVTREKNGKINAYYDINQKNNTKIILNGSYNVYIENGNTYEDLGINAIDKDGNDVTSSVEVSGTINMLEEGKNVITYKHGNTTIKRNVYVQDNSVSFAGTKYLYELLKDEETLNNGLIQTTATYTTEDGIKIIVDAGIRYTGSNPNNKVYYNCEEKDENNVTYGSENYDYASSCEIWRIIGVFNVQDGSGNIEKRMKIINKESTFMSSWDSSRYVSSTDHVNWGEGINQWGESKYSNGDIYEGADLMRLLNGYYIGKSGSTCRYCNDWNQETCEQVCDTEENTLASQKMKPLTSIAKSMTKNAVWDTYAVGDFSLLTEVYLQEKGLTAQYTGKSLCVANGGGIYCNDNVERTTSWTGIVGLVSAYDIYGANGWLYDPGTSIWPWSITPYVDSDNAIYVWSAGAGCVANLSQAVWPALYLKSNIQIIGGDGSEGNAYKLKT